MRLVFLGSRGEIDASTRLHRRHSALLLEEREARVMIDCGLDWRGELERLDPAAVVVTHAHLDHAGGLRDGAPCPVHATEETWRAIGKYRIRERGIAHPRRPFDLYGFTFEAFPVAHSLRAPAVGYRITASGRALFYVPDVVAIDDRQDALTGLALYVGDGASLTRPILRRRDGTPIGHAPIRAQLEWCAAEGVSRAIFTHCGSEIVKGEDAILARRVQAMGEECSVEAAIAYDGMVLEL